MALHVSQIWNCRSDRSVEWNHVSDKDKKKLGLIFEADGEFYMSNKVNIYFTIFTL